MGYYAGIGSRDTPKVILKYMIIVSKYLSNNGYTLRSGGAKGADTAFEVGCDIVNDKKEIYLPWEGFEKSKSKLIVSNKNAFYLAKKYHPFWDGLKSGAKKLQARNTHQVLGEDLSTPSDFILCYTKNGNGNGGTGQAIRIAKDYNIPIFDFGNYFKKEFDIDRCKKDLKIFIKENSKIEID